MNKLLRSCLTACGVGLLVLGAGGVVAAEITSASMNCDASVHAQLVGNCGLVNRAETASEVLIIVIIGAAVVVYLLFGGKRPRERMG